MRKHSHLQQLSFSFGRTPEDLRDFLEQELRKPLSLIITANSTTMLSVRKRNDMLQVRLHGMFLQAGEDVIMEILSFLRNKRSRMPLFRAFIRQHQEILAARPKRQISCRTAGRWHDLREVFDSVNRQYFSGSITSSITWGSRRPAMAVRKRTLGSFCERTNTIRINRVLDRKRVPRYYIAFIVYHEMLHAAIGIAVKGSRRSMHSPEFKKREQMYGEYDKAIAWEKRMG